MKLTTPTVCILALSVGGCPSDDASPEASGSGGVTTDAIDGSTGATTTAADASSSSGGGDPFPQLIACDETDFEPTPFMGPGFDPDTGELVAPLEPPYIVAATIGWPKPEPQFFEELGMHSELVSTEVFGSEGLIGASFGGSEVCGNARTLTIWADEEALMNFVFSGAHLAAIAIVPTSMLAWETTHWTEASSTEPPTWDLATQKLIEAHGS